MHNPQFRALIRASLISGVALILGLCFDFFFYRKTPGIAFPLYIVLIVAGLILISKRLGKKLDREVISLLVPLAFFSSMVFVRSSILLTFLNVVASLLLLLLIAEVSSATSVRSLSVGGYVAIAFLPFRFIHPLFQTLLDMLRARRVQGEQQMLLAQIARGVLMALPPLFIFIVLFSSADLIFQKYVTQLLNVDIEPETISRLFLVLLTTLAFIGAYSYIFRQTDRPLAQPQNDKPYLVGPIETAILLGSVNALFLIFIVVQFAYLFGGERNIAAQGVTYAEYARRGFFELIAVAVISLLLLWTMDKYFIDKSAGTPALFKALSGALIVQVMVVMVSAFIRLLLYERAYGFTTLRLYSHIFIIFLGVVFILLLHKLVRNAQEETFAFRSFVAVNVFLAGMNFLNPDAFIARRNMERFATIGKLDGHYLSSLSDDAVPEIVQLLSMANDDLRRQLGGELYWRAQRRNSPFFSKWQSFNLSRMNAARILEARIDELEPFRGYVEPGM